MKNRAIYTYYSQKMHFKKRCECKLKVHIKSRSQKKNLLIFYDVTNDLRAFFQSILLWLNDEK